GGIHGVQARCAAGAVLRLRVVRPSSAPRVAVDAGGSPADRGVLPVAGDAVRLLDGTSFKLSPLPTDARDRRRRSVTGTVGARARGLDRRADAGGSHLRGV